MKKRRHVHFCEFGHGPARRGTSTGKKVSPLHNPKGATVVKNIFDRYYKGQVAALYRAIRSAD